MTGPRQIFTNICGLAVVVAGVSVLVGWSANAVWLKSVVPGLVAMNPLTAVCFMITGLSLVLLSKQPISRSRKTMATLAASAVAAVGGLRLSADLLFVDFDVDRLMFASSLSGNRMAPNTAVCFLLIGLSLLLLDFVPRRIIWPAQVFALLVATVALVSLVGYGYGAESLYHIAFIPMALNTAAVFLLLSIGVLLARPERGVVAVLIHEGPGGVMTRRLLPTIIAIPLLGWLRILGQHMGFYDTEFGAAFMVATTIMLFLIAMVWIASALNRSDEERRRAEQAVRQFNAELEQRVNDRTEELAKRDEQLRQAQKMEAIGTLAGGIAHEFNNLLQAIQGYTRFAMEGLETDSERYNDLQQVIEASDRATTLTRQLLGFSRRDVLEMTSIEPNALVTSLMKMIQPLIGEHITLETKLGENVGVIHADVGHFQQMLMNLCVNARDAMPLGGRMTIRTEDLVLNQAYCDAYGDIRPGRYLMLSVADTGSGMPPDVKEHIFEPFFTTKEVGKGTGLGLAMVYGVVKQHLGAIRVYSEVGIGTTFRIYLPTVDHEAAESIAIPAAPVQGGTETILIAEDDPVVRELTVRILTRAGYDTITAVDGEEAVELFQKNSDRIALALLDVVMPRLAGREALDRIQAIRPDTKVLFCSGYDPEMAQVGFVMEGDHRLLHKPIDPDVLLRTIREVLEDELCRTS